MIEKVERISEFIGRLQKFIGYIKIKVLIYIKLFKSFINIYSIYFDII